MAQHVITLEDLWVQYWANGGCAKEEELDAYLNGVLEPDAFELAVLGWALEDLAIG
ncbi:hypothetical protein [Arthrobacter sp. ISL-28]|uniref:hypothetical protein n=1 Tax=Arthrobacter sp. ISL-28 TaxID=2819108 RepID=UPI0020362475|nr:hypothetical protein [Arthrobacter sp. ISL-28]